MPPSGAWGSGNHGGSQTPARGLVPRSPASVRPARTSSLLIVAALALSACGSDEDEGTDRPASTGASAQKKAGKLPSELVGRYTTTFTDADLANAPEDAPFETGQWE